MTSFFHSNDRKNYEVKIKSPSSSKYGSVIENIIPKPTIDEMIQNYSNNNKTSQNPNKEYSYDILVENQRGAIIFGLPFFTKYLLPYDPANFTNANGATISELRLFPLPDLNWEWSWDKWYVLMQHKDTDDQGWIYSWRFNSNHWSGEQRLGCFVRRRLWLRLREKEKCPVDEQQLQGDQEYHKNLL